MPKNKGLGGKGHRKRKGTVSLKREMTWCGDDQAYAQVLKITGGLYVQVQCFDATGKSLFERKAHIRGKMRKRVWLSPGDSILVNLRNYQDDTCDVLLKYTPDEVRQLKAKGFVPYDETNDDVMMDEVDESDESDDSELVESGESGELEKLDEDKSEESEDSKSYDSEIEDLKYL